ncbi:hypothetical protein GCM10010452_09860 [Crossiella cryophila]
MVGLGLEVVLVTGLVLDGEVVGTELEVVVAAAEEVVPGGVVGVLVCASAIGAATTASTAAPATARVNRPKGFFKVFPKMCTRPQARSQSPREVRLGWRELARRGSSRCNRNGVRKSTGK